MKNLSTEESSERSYGDPLYIIPTEDEDGGDVEMGCVIEQASVMISANNLGHGVNKATAA